MPAENHRIQLAELQALRRAGKKTFANYQVENFEAIYEEVDDDSFRSILRARLDQADFVVDDNGDGYADDGRDDWENAGHDKSDSETGTARHGLKLPEISRASHGPKPKRIHDEPGGNDRPSSCKLDIASSSSNKADSARSDHEFLENLLHDVDSGRYAVPKNILLQSCRRNSAAVNFTPTPRCQQEECSCISSPSTEINSSTHPIGLLQVPRIDSPSNGHLSTSPAQIAEINLRYPDQEHAQECQEGDTLQVANADRIEVAGNVNLIGSHAAEQRSSLDYHFPSYSCHHMEQAIIDGADATSVNELFPNLREVRKVIDDLPEGIDVGDVVEPDGHVSFFWIDYSEVNGTLCLFGKVRDRKTGQHVSCAVKINNILRKIFFLPRQWRSSGREDFGEDLKMKEVYEEVDGIMTKMNIDSYKIKACNRKYAFDLSDVPAETQYLKLLYPYTHPQISNLEGETFTHVFGTNTALFEQFVLWKNVMGPCWLKITGARFDVINQISHCKLEISIDNPDLINTMKETDSPEPPPFTLMSLALRHVFNPASNQREIIAISVRVYEVALTDSSPAEELCCRSFTVIRPYGQGFPFGFEALAKQRTKGLLILRRQESELLAFFLGQMDVIDPDVVLGHKIEGADYNILLSRLQERRVHQWSRLGRLRRSHWPASLSTRSYSGVIAERQISAGRLLCDLANDAGRSVFNKCQTWSLTEMCNLYLSKQGTRRDVDNDTALRSWANEKHGLMDYVLLLESDTYYIAALTLTAQLLPLTKVLTNLAGNSWARTLTGSRAEANDFILLHEFTRNGYICPDKRQFARNQLTAASLDQHDADKKEKYQGGLVFEPEKGLYDRFVLVMDFNSLYPSIIQEYNICFTTIGVNFSVEGDTVAPMAPASQQQGLLPRLIATLVNRRRQVKSLMKDQNATKNQLSSWDIKQQALKLTANSMYGCLGYSKSRFYARPLAALTTFRGREVLRDTKALADKRSLQVIYGDTDSVMLYANVDSLADALKIGEDFRKNVNQRYKFLEIEIDNIFKRLLLQAKKKYAAIRLVENHGKYEESLEVKGLDMKRREFCALSKEVSEHLLNEILSGDDTEVVMARVHDFLRNIAHQMRRNAVPTAKYVIYTQLGKDPSEYPNADSMPQVQVALRQLSHGRKVRKGDVVSYIITGNDQNSERASRRARAPYELKSDHQLRPDVEWYLAKQILPPVERLCANIAGTSVAQLSAQLGLENRQLDVSQPQRKSPDNGLELHPLESQLSETTRFSKCAKLTLRCSECGYNAVFEGLAAAHHQVSALGLHCMACEKVLQPVTIIAQVERAIRDQANSFYSADMVCDDPQCSNRTRQMSVYGQRCLGMQGLSRGCTGRMRCLCTEKAICNQLLYFSSLWEIDKICPQAAEINDGNAKLMDASSFALLEHNRSRFTSVKQSIESYTEKCGRQWVAMDMLFAKV